jgi:hypothetical protein
LEIGTPPSVDIEAYPKHEQVASPVEKFRLHLLKEIFGAKYRQTHAIRDLG